MKDQEIFEMLDFALANSLNEHELILLTKSWIDQDLTKFLYYLTPILPLYINTMLNQVDPIDTQSVPEKLPPME